jgi:hypothetical protein
MGRRKKKRRKGKKTKGERREGRREKRKATTAALGWERCCAQIATFAVQRRGPMSGAQDQLDERSGRRQWKE